MHQTVRMKEGKTALDRRGLEARNAIIQEMAKAGVPAETLKRIMECPATRKHLNARAAARVRLGLRRKAHQDVSIL